MNFLQKFSNNKTLYDKVESFINSLDENEKIEYEKYKYSKNSIEDISKDSNLFKNKFIKKLISLEQKSKDSGFVVGKGEIFLCYIIENCYLVSQEDYDLLINDSKYQIKHYPKASNIRSSPKVGSTSKFEYWDNVMIILKNIVKSDSVVKEIDYFKNRMNIILNGEFNNKDISNFEKMIVKLSKMDIFIPVKGFSVNLLEHSYFKDINNLHIDYDNITKQIFNHNKDITLCILTDNDIIINPNIEFKVFSQNMARYKVI